jgi:hypothetical protein
MLLKKEKKDLPNKGMELDFEKLALFKTTHAQRSAFQIMRFE